jgi:REP element-mobilizing transposase RayT
MARAWRIEFEGALYHVFSRGNEGRGIVADDVDRKRVLETIGDVAERFDVEIFAYVLMTNHYHLLLRTRQANLSRAMQWFGTAYTRRFNNRHGRGGHLFQGRFKSILVENDAYLLRLSLYIHRNPLRAGLTERLADYPWSSYRAYAYGRGGPDWLCTDLVLSQLQGKDPHKIYREKAKGYAEEEERLWEDLRHGILLGSQEFVEKIRRGYLTAAVDGELPQQRAVAKSVGVEHFVRQAAEVFGWGAEAFAPGRRKRGERKLERDVVVYRLWASGLYTNEEIGRPFGMSSSAVSHSVQATRSALRANERLREKYTLFNS